MPTDPIRRSAPPAPTTFEELQQSARVAEAEARASSSARRVPRVVSRDEPPADLGEFPAIDRASARAVAEGATTEETVPTVPPTGGSASGQIINVDPPPATSASRGGARATTTPTTPTTPSKKGR